MSPQTAFMLETSIVNSPAIFPAALVIAYIAGPFLINVGANKYLRIIIYSLVGVSAGVWSYSTFGIPDRSIEPSEAAILVTGMLIYSLLVIAPVVLMKKRPRS